MLNKNILVVSNTARSATEIAYELAQCGLNTAARGSILGEIPNYVRGIVIDNVNGELDETVKNVQKQPHLFVKIFVLEEMEEQEIYEEDRILYIPSKIGKKNACQIVNFCANPLCDAERMARETLFNLGFMSYLRGHRYIIDAVKIGLENPNALYNMGKSVYEVLGTMHNCSSGAIERSIRHSIELAYDNDTEKRFTAFFGPLNHKPTNAEFIGCIVEKILMSFN